MTWGTIKSVAADFFIGEYFTDALRNTLVIVLPIVLFFYLGDPKAAIGIGVGTLLISLTDLPGNKTDKFKTAFLSVGVFFLTALLFSLSLSNVWLTGLAFFILTFLLSMLSVFGSRAALTGTMAIILSTFTLGLHPDHPLLFSVYILFGGLWYYIISLVQIMIWPYRSLHHAIFECLRSTAVFLKAKANCYDPAVPLDQCYRESIVLHMKVSEKQDLIRSLLLSDKHAMAPGNRKGRRLIRTAQNVISIYEQVTAIHYDYALIRNKLSEGGYLVDIVKQIKELSAELNEVSKIFLRKTSLKNNAGKGFFIAKPEHKVPGEQEIILSRISGNMQDIRIQIAQLRSGQLADSDLTADDPDQEDYRAFLTSRSWNITAILAQFSFKSPVFRFSLRLSISFLMAYFIIILFPSEKYSYWILLTIVIVARPRFGITWKRNKERLLGTLGGVVIGFALLFFIRETAVLLVFSAIFLVGFFAFNRIKYAVSVMCITPAVILCLSIYHGHTDHILTERIYYTEAGCIIAFAGVYLFPVWERRQLHRSIYEAVRTNLFYFREVIHQQESDEINVTAPRLARKAAHLALARLSDAIQHLLAEPRGKKTDLSGVYVIQALNYRINSVITSLFLLPAGDKEIMENKSLTVEIADHLTTCLECDPFKAFPNDHPLHAENMQIFLSPMNHLLKLSAELKAYCQPEISGIE